MTNLSEVKDLVKEVGSQVDKNTESGEERQQVLTERHQIDMQSDSTFSKIIRPGTLAFLLLLQGAIVFLGAFGRPVPEDIVYQHGILLFGAFSFYFQSKKAERVAGKNAEANIRMKELELKHELKEDRRASRHERREERRAGRREEGTPDPGEV